MRDGTICKGIHAVYSGVNSAAKIHFGPDFDPVAVTKALDAKGVIAVRPCKGGVMLYLPEDAPVKGESSGKAALKAMGLD